jgi:hypothetical protein
VTCDRFVDCSGYSNFRHKSSKWNIFESGVKHLTSNGHMMDQKFVYVVHNIKHLWVIMWHIFTSTNNTTTILFPTQLWELLYIYHVIKQCTEKETTSLSNVLLTIKLNYLHDLKIMSCFSVYYILICTCRYGWILISCLNWKLQ